MKLRFTERTVMFPTKPAYFVFVGCVAITMSTCATCECGESESTNRLSPLSGDFFESKVRPILAENCYTCHSAKKQESNLRLDSRSAILTGGENGPAVDLESLDKSLLLQAINYDGLEMPPKGKLNKDQIAVLTKWIRTGALWPDSAETPPQTTREEFTITDLDKAFWAFQPIKRPALPNVNNANWVSSPIDRFVLKKLEMNSLEPNQIANRRTLIRRAYFDLIGLPPDPEEVDRFVQSDEPDAYARLIDNLMSRPQFGERWGRHWLDVVRFGQTNGYERDDEKIGAWRYRDYVIRAFNQDKPYDKFVIEQLAGDELAEPTHDSIIATAFYRVGIWDDEPAEKTRALFDELDDHVRVTGSAFLGMTIGCARCHDHMFDPISQEDYYRFLAFFRNITPYGRDRGGNSETHWEVNKDAVYTPIGTVDQVTAWRQKKDETNKRIQNLEQQIKRIASDGKETEHKHKLQIEIKTLRDSIAKSPFQEVLSVRESSPQVLPTHLLIRGDPNRTGKAVNPKPLSVLDAVEFLQVVKLDESKSNSLRRGMAELGVRPTSGRRKALADWIIAKENPLTARVVVNRVWQHLFARGIVRTPNNFGHNGRAPTHPELLDWLAWYLQENGYQIKPLIKEIVSSSTYRMTSGNSNRRHRESDPDNELFWRQNIKRLTAEAIRDSILAVSDELNFELGGRGIFPNLSQEVLATQSRPGAGWKPSSNSQRHRRSVYIFVKRTLMVPMLEVFDYTNTAEPLGQRPTTTVAPQALMLLNDRFVEDQAAAFAQQVLDLGTALDQQIISAFQLALAREPTATEVSIARKLISRTEENRMESLKSLCLVLFNSNEFVYID